MSLDALEFKSPATINTGQFNRNIRKFRLLQYDPDGSGLQPVLVGVYNVDPLTGQPIPNSLTSPSIAANPYQVYYTVIGANATDHLLPATAGKTYTIMSMWMQLGAGGSTYTFAGTISTNFVNGTVAANQAGNVLFNNFGPYGVNLALGEGLDITTGAGGGITTFIVAGLS